MVTLAARPSNTANVRVAFGRIVAGGITIGAGGGALGGAIVAAITLGQQSAGQAPWLPLALGTGGLLGIILGQRIGGGRAGLLARSASLLGALAGLVLGLHAWLCARLVATGAAETLFTALSDAATAIGTGATSGLLLGAGLGALVGLLAGATTVTMVALGTGGTTRLRLSPQH